MKSAIVQSWSSQTSNKKYVFNSTGPAYLTEDALEVLRSLFYNNENIDNPNNGNSPINAGILSEVFDAVYYAERYPDVAEEFGDDELSLLNHFLEFGLLEGRAGSDLFDVSVYKNANPDLMAAFGDDMAAYVLHFLEYGSDENRLTGLGIISDSLKGNEVEVRINIYDPLKASISAGPSLAISGQTSGDEVTKKVNTFQKFFQNDIKMVSLDHQGNFGHDVRIAAKVDVSRMNTSNLYFYSYSAKTNRYIRIERTNYKIDANGYVHFSTDVGGDIIISDGPLESR
ncbi:MAG: hypothetical protein FWG91_02090 [Lachnospiraceae bacterium]|nr:hypothetical protein [Lachnospiraceae bacterium]